MKKYAIFVAFLSMLVIQACNSQTSPSPQPRIEISGIQEGQTLKRGEPVNLSWRCIDCNRIRRKIVEISIVTEDTTQRYSRLIGKGLLNESMTWIAGETEGGFVSSGLYSIGISTPTVWTSSNSGYIEAAGDTDVFRLTR